MDIQNIIKILEEKHGYDGITELNLFLGERQDVTDEEYADEVARALDSIGKGNFEELGDEENSHD